MQAPSAKTGGQFALNYRMRNIKLIIQYDGTNYSGWQVQPDAVSIQGLIEKFLKKITGEDIDLIAAGRTDAGVHAFGQAACFKTSSRLPADTLRNALNAHLPYDIRIIKAQEVDSSFHARFSAHRKSYFYMVSTDRIVSPFLHRYVWRSLHKIDIPPMRESISYLMGTHDFSAFRASGCGAKTPVRTIFSSTVESLDAIEFMSLRISGNFIKFRFEGDAFLRHMVRNMVGTLVEVGKGKLKPEDVEKIIAGKDRKCAGPTAPSKGLFLEKIVY